MATNNRGCDYSDLWRIYKESETYRAQILHWMNLEKTLPILSYKTQLEVLDNCPMDIVKKHVHLLHDRTKRALGLEEKSSRKQKESIFEWSTFS